MMITRIPCTGYGTVEQRENPPRNESFTQSDLTNLERREHRKVKQYNSVPWERLGAEVLALSR